MRQEGTNLMWVQQHAHCAHLAHTARLELQHPLHAQAERIPTPQASNCKRSARPVRSAWRVQLELPTRKVALQAATAPFQAKRVVSAVVRALRATTASRVVRVACPVRAVSCSRILVPTLHTQPHTVHTHTPPRMQGLKIPAMLLSQPRDDSMGSWAANQNRHASSVKLDATLSTAPQFVSFAPRTIIVHEPTPPLPSARLAMPFKGSRVAVWTPRQPR